MDSAEPVTIITEVRRGSKILLRIGCGVNGPAGWISPNPDCDIVTPQGNICEIFVHSGTRHAQWQYSIPEEKLPTHELSPEERTFMEDYIPF